MAKQTYPLGDLCKKLKRACLSSQPNYESIVKLYDVHVKDVRQTDNKFRQLGKNI